jgi:hypothetical protein
VTKWTSNIGVGSNAGVWEVQNEKQSLLFEEYIFWEARKYSVAVYRLRDSNPCLLSMGFLFKQI